MFNTEHPGGQAGGPKAIDLCRVETSENAISPFAAQARRIAERFGLSRATAQVVASHAFAVGPRR